MPVEFIGTARTAYQSETVTAVGPAVQPDYLYRLARAHERAGFDRVLIEHSASSPDGFVVADQVLSVTSELGVLLAHRPGFIAPMVAARKFATFDALHPGRIALHVSTGGVDADQARDGDFVAKPARYRRTDEFLQIVTRAWRGEAPLDFRGEFFRVTGGRAAVQPARGRLPVYFAGASPEAAAVGGRHADVYAFWGEPLAGITERIGQVRAAAAAAGRVIDRFCVSLRPIVAATETAAWNRAHQLLELSREQAAHDEGPRDGPGSEGARRLLRFAAAGDRHDKRLWTAMARATGAPGNSTALVGSYEQVAQALLDYVRLGATTLLIRGYDPLADATDYGALVELVHEQVGTDIDAYRRRAAA